MANVIEVIDEKRETVGSITFEQASEALTAFRRAAGFDLHLPMTVRLELRNRVDPCPMLSNLSAVITAIGDAQNLLTVGRAVGRIGPQEWFVGQVKESRIGAALIWSDTIPALAAYERFRDGRLPRFKITIAAEFCYLIPPAIPGRTGLKWRTEPFPVHGEAEVSYQTEVWIKMLRHLNVSHPVLLEIPLPSSPPKPWGAVWHAIAEASSSFERGGETGWKGCISAVRLALDRWREIEAEDMGPGWARPNGDDLRKRTTKQRLDNIRWHLREYTYLAPHSGAEEFARDDALLMLSTLSALLVVRKP